MRVELAENISEITLGQYQKYDHLNKRTDLNLLEYNKRKLKIFTGLTYAAVSAIKQTDLEDLIKTINEALGQNVKFDERFTMNGIEFGFIPNLNEIKAKEYFDLSTYGTKVEDLHKTMAVLFRPVTHEKDGKYEIAEYRGTNDFAEMMKQTPLHIVNGALFFFQNLAKDCNLYIQKSILKAEQMKAKQSHTLRNGVGTQRLIDLQRANPGNLGILKKWASMNFTYS